MQYKNIPNIECIDYPYHVRTVYDDGSDSVSHHTNLQSAKLSIASSKQLNHSDCYRKPIHYEIWSKNKVIYPTACC